MKHAHREYEVTICPKCGAGLVVMPQMNHVCDIKKDEKKSDISCDVAIEHNKTKKGRKTKA